MIEERLWTPWRMRYVSGDANPTDGCVFCDLPVSSDDADNLIVARAEHVYAVMNLFPYNTGHMLIVPYAHVASPEEAPLETLTELMAMTRAFLGGMRRALGCAGFNLGFNVGEIAGAGIAAHLHQHIVPRWKGDANFMPLVGGVKVLPELIPATYAKIRAEITRNEESSVSIVCFDGRGERVLINGDSRSLPAIETDSDVNRPAWAMALQALSSTASEIDLVGWASAGDSSSAERAGFVFTGVPRPSEAEFQWMAVEEALRLLLSPDANLLQNAFRRAISDAHAAAPGS